ncbi:hypothetical protein SeMB42_g00161 [Synchytrium endobioticum]|uniref:Uncharacterized protein n=1 Tax=Synchytrium endobioticum TaxID=286115 RepID=A0A507DSZ3_9FUNG|nr:hypothetical protein SeMB42_g00161 [Synchytrium endobioticum]
MIQHILNCLMSRIFLFSLLILAVSCTNIGVHPEPCPADIKLLKDQELAYEKQETAVEEHRGVYDLSRIIGQHFTDVRRDLAECAVLVRPQPAPEGSTEYFMFKRQYHSTLLAYLKCLLRIIINTYKYHDLCNTNGKLSTIFRKELLLRADMTKQAAEEQLQYINEYGERLKMEKVPLSKVLIDDDGMGVEGAKSSCIEELISDIEKARRIMDLENAKLDAMMFPVAFQAFPDGPSREAYHGTSDLMTCGQLNEIFVKLKPPPPPPPTPVEPGAPDITHRLHYVYIGAEFQAAHEARKLYAARYLQLDDEALSKVPPSVVDSFRKFVEPNDVGIEAESGNFVRMSRQIYNRWVLTKDYVRIGEDEWKASHLARMPALDPYIRIVARLQVLEDFQVDPLVDVCLSETALGDDESQKNFPNVTYSRATQQ